MVVVLRLVDHLEMELEGMEVMINLVELEMLCVVAQNC